jgi:hypothetical protein
VPGFKVSMRVVAASLLISGSLVSDPAVAERPYIAIEQRLSAEQMLATGLNQLNPEQLSLLNDLLREEQTNVAAESAAAERDRTKQEAQTPVSSRLKEFRGWQNGTVFGLENGQHWRVLGDEFYASKRLLNPNVTVKPGLLGSWYLQIEGVSVAAKVKRVDP